MRVRPTHMCVGAAAALAILRPPTIGGCLVAVAGGYLGGWICDTDLNSKSRLGRRLAGLDDIIAPLAALALADYLLGCGVGSYLVLHRCRQSLSGLVAFMAISAIGATTTRHREFMHSLTAVALLSAALAYAFPPVVAPFVIGMLLHIFLDLFNGTKVRILYPLRLGLCFGLCESDGTADKVIGSVARIALVGLLVWLIASAAGVSGVMVSSLCP